MNKFAVSTLTACLACGSLAMVQAAEPLSQEDIQQRCQTYAKEDGILAEELAAYVEDCVQAETAAYADLADEPGDAE